MARLDQLMRLAAALAIALAGPQALHAQTDAPAQRPRGVEVSRQAVEQKTSMLDKLVFNSPFAARVGGSQNEDAHRHLTNARELYAHARALMGSGQLRGADLLLNEAIWEVGRAQQLVPNQATRLAEERARYQQLKDSADALLRTYQIGVHGTDLTLRSEVAAERPVIAAMAAVEQARGLADAGRIVDANRDLERALTLLLKDALSRLEGRTLTYDKRFANSREEYAFELARLRNFEGLVPLAIVEYRPSKEAVALIDRYVANGRTLCERAEAQAARGEHAAAIQSLNEGTDNLQRALRASGLSVPQTMGSQ